MVIFDPFTLAKICTINLVKNLISLTGVYNINITTYISIFYKTFKYKSLILIIKFLSN